VLIADGRIQLDETPAGMVASERFETCFRIRQSGGGWTVRPSAGPLSSP
jgi:hypothetical protein